MKEVVKKKTTEIIKNELLGMKERLRSFEVLACQADLVVLTIVCCDSRVVLPDTLQTIQTAEGTKQVLFIPIPTIGSGAPSRSRLRGVLSQIRSWGVDPEKIRLLVTQHGDTQEVEGEHDHITCGLRKFFDTNKKELKRLRRQLIPWSVAYKRTHQDRSLAPDRLSLEILRREAPAIMNLVDRLYEASGKDSATRIPRRLLIRSAYRNSDFDLEENEIGVFERLQEYLQDPEYSDITGTCQIGIAKYDHQKKQLLMHNADANLAFPPVIEFPELTARTDSHQDPDYVVISFGAETIPHPISTILPEHCGTQIPDNAFRTVASIPTVPTLLCAMAEGAYAILHHNHPHDKNFVNLKKLLILCDNDAYVQVVQEMMRDPEFREEYLPMLKTLQPDGIPVINLKLGSKMQIESEIVPYH